MTEENCLGRGNGQESLLALGGTRQTLTYDAPIPAAQLLTQPCPIYTCACWGELGEVNCTSELGWVTASDIPQRLSSPTADAISVPTLQP